MTVSLTAPRRVLADHCLFTEDPRWHDGRLYFSDTIAGRVCAVDLAGRLDVVATLDDHCSGLGFMQGGELLIVSAGKRQLVLRGSDGELRLHADLSALAAQGINDMVVDADGRAYVGELRFDPSQPLAPVPGKLFLVQPDGAVEVAADDMLMSNGSVIAPDGHTLLVAETMGCRITAFDIGAEGRLSGRRVFAQLPQGYFPDGIALDGEGGVWAACPYDHGVVRVVEGGAITHRLSLEDDRAAYACMLGGPQRRTLLLCTAEKQGHDRLRELKSSRIEAVDVEFEGAGVP